MRLDSDTAVEAGWLSVVCLRCDLTVGVAVAGSCVVAAEKSAGTDAANGSMLALGLPLKMHANAVLSLSLHLRLSMTPSQFVSLSETARLRLFAAEMTAHLFGTQRVIVSMNMMVQHQDVLDCQQP